MAGFADSLNEALTSPPRVPPEVALRLRVLQDARPTGTVTDESSEYERFVYWRDGEWTREEKFDVRLVVEFYCDRRDGEWEARWQFERKHRTNPGSNRKPTIVLEAPLKDEDPAETRRRLQAALALL